MRSFLFVPSDDDRKIAKALGSGADALLLDLEDSIAPSRKAAARAIVRDFLKDCPKQDGGDGPRIFVRVNALDSPFLEEDLEAISGGGYDGIVQPKASGGASVLELHRRLPVPKPILAIATETAQALFSWHTYGIAASVLLGLTWGAEDLSSDLGAQSSCSLDGTLTDPYRLARSLCLIGAKGIGCEAIDKVFVAFRDCEGLEAECAAALRDGFFGKMAIHPAQVPIINRCFTPSPEDIAHAQRVVDAFEAQPELGVLSLDNQMYDRPHLERARKTLLRAGILK